MSAKPSIWVTVGVSGADVTVLSAGTSRDEAQRLVPRGTTGPRKAIEVAPGRFSGTLALWLSGLGLWPGTVQTLVRQVASEVYAVVRRVLARRKGQ